MTPEILVIQSASLIHSPQFLPNLKPVVLLQNALLINDFQVLLTQFYNLAPHSTLLFDFLNPHLDLSKAVFLKIEDEQEQKQQFESPQDPRKFSRGACGGTFDYIHPGHKLMLSIALLTVKDFLTVGITGMSLLQKKKHKELIQSLQTRQRAVAEFCNLFSPNCQIHLPELDEPAGPTKDGEYEVLIVSEETQNAIGYINNLRGERNLNPLEAVIVKVIGESVQNKLSSSQMRELIFQKCSDSYDVKNYVSQKWLEESTQDQYVLENVVIPLYCEPQRYYHTLCHVSSLLKALESYQCDDRMAMFYAIVFHDIVYDPKRNDNEKQSALLFRRFSPDPTLTEKVEKFILATEKHLIDEHSDEDLKLFLDLDLFILAENPANYDEYSKQIRLEYCFYDDASYRAGRIKVLTSFLARDKIYFRCNDKEQLARENIQREINFLKQF